MKDYVAKIDGGEGEKPASRFNSGRIYMCQIDGHKKTVMDAINAFCEEMFEDKREVDPATIAGNAFANNGLSFQLVGGRYSYKVVYRNGMKAFEFFKESEI